MERRDGLAEAAEHRVAGGRGQQPHRRRPDLGDAAGVDAAAEREREQLRPEADAVERHVVGDGAADQVELGPEPVEVGGGEQAHRAAEGDDTVDALERGRYRIAGLAVDQHHLGAAVGQHSA